MRPGFWIVFTIASLVSLTHLGTARLWDRDEPRNAQCAREMYAAGEWVVPTFDGELRTHKPALLYWCQIAAYHALGVNEWAARLPSALAGIATALLVWWSTRRFAAADVAAYSGVALATMLLFVMAARAATPDALLVLSITLAIALFTRFAWQPDSDADLESGLRRGHAVWPRWHQWALIYAACGLAVLAKGPVGLLLPIAVMGLTTLWVHAAEEVSFQTKRVGRRSEAASRFGRTLCWLWDWTGQTIRYGWRMRPLTAVAMVLLVAGPWYVAVGWATEGRWLREFFLTHNISRAVSPMEGHSGPPLLFYLAALLAGTFPWSCFAIPIGLAVRSQTRDGGRLHPLFALAMAWIGVFVVAFSLASTKLPSYITPCYPGAAMLSGWFVARAARGEVLHRRWFVAGLTVAAMIGVGLFVAIAGPLASELPSVRPVAICGAIFAVAGILGVALSRRSRIDLAARSFAIGAVVLIWILHGFGPAAVDRGRRDLDALQAAFLADPQTRWVCEGPVEPSWVFYSNGRVDRTAVRADRLAPGDTLGSIAWTASPAEGAVPIFMDDQFLRVVAPGEAETIAIAEPEGRVR